MTKILNYPVMLSVKGADEKKLLTEINALVQKARQQVKHARDNGKRVDPWLERFAVYTGSLLGKLRIARKQAEVPFVGTVVNAEALENIKPGAIVAVTPGKKKSKAKRKSRA